MIKARAMIMAWDDGDSHGSKEEKLDEESEQLGRESHDVERWKNVEEQSEYPVVCQSLVSGRTVFCSGF